MTDELGPRQPPRSLRPWRGVSRRRRAPDNPRFSFLGLDNLWGMRPLGFVRVINQSMAQMWEEFPESDGHA